MSSARSHSRERGADVPAYDPVSAGGTEPGRRLRELAHSAPCVLHLVEGNDSRRRATPFDPGDVIASPRWDRSPFRVLLLFAAWRRWPILHDAAERSSAQPPRPAGSVHTSD